MEALLADRPPTVGDRVDLALAAVDAHMFPPSTASPRTGHVRARLSAVFALIGAAVWTEAVILSLIDSWDVGLVFQCSAGFLVLGSLCAAPRASSLIGWAAASVALWLIASTGASFGAWPWSFVVAIAMTLVVASTPLGWVAHRAGIFGVERMALVAWGAIVPVTVAAAGSIVALHGDPGASTIGAAAWLTASALWIASWALVGLKGVAAQRAQPRRATTSTT